MSASYDVKKNPDKLLAKPSQIDVVSMQLLLFAWSVGVVRSHRWSKWQILENPKHDQFLLFLLVHRLYIIFRKNKESMNQEPMKKFNICLLQVQRLLWEKYSRWRFSAKSALLEECPDKWQCFQPMIEVRLSSLLSIIFASYFWNHQLYSYAYYCSSRPNHLHSWL